VTYFSARIDAVPPCASSASHSAPFRERSGAEREDRSTSIAWLPATRSSWTTLCGTRPSHAQESDRGPWRYRRSMKHMLPPETFQGLIFSVRPLCFAGNPPQESDVDQRLGPKRAQCFVEKEDSPHRSHRPPDPLPRVRETLRCRSNL